MAAESAVEAAFAPFREEGRALLPDGAGVLDAHTHLGVDEDGQSLELDALLAALDEASPGARACTFPLHDPDPHRGSGRRTPRVLGGAAEGGGGRTRSGGLAPPGARVGGGGRGGGGGAGGIKLPPRARGFGLGI